jgi:flagellar M-ring protein FliF
MNSDVTTWLAKLKTWYGGLSRRQRLNGFLIAGFLILTIIILSAILLNPNYEVVFSNLDAKSAGQITKQLQQLKVPYELQGNSILVPAAQADQTRLDMAEQGLPASGLVDYSQIFSSGTTFGMSGQELDLQAQSILQQRIAETIDSIDGVESAVVNIVPAQTSSFLEPTSDLGAKASVLLTLGAGVTLSPQQIAGIQQLVAHSVSGLAASDVTVLDQNGTDLSAAQANSSLMAAGGLAEELALRQQVEQSLQTQLQNSLQSFVGAGNVSVIVHANVTFNQTSTQVHKVTGGPPLSEQKSTSNSSGGSGQTGGIAGQATQNPNIVSYGSTGTGQSTSSTRTSTVNYDNSYVNTQQVADPMQIGNYTVSVLINSTAVKVTPALTTAMESYVAHAMGVQGKRIAASDVSILAVPFTVSAIPPTTSLFTSPLAYAGLLVGLLALGAIATILVVRSRNRRRVTDDALGSLSVASLSSPPPEPEEVTLSRKLQELAARRPESFAALLRTWLSDE